MSSGLTLPRAGAEAWGGRSGQAGGRQPQGLGEQQRCREHLLPSLGHRCRAALEMRHVGTGVPASSPEDTLSWQALTVLPRQTLPPTPPSHLLRHSFGSPFTLHHSPTCSLPPRSARPAAWDSLSGHRGALSCPSGCAQTKAYATGSCEVPAAKRICAQWGINTHSRPRITLLLRTLDPQMPRLPKSGSILSLHEPPQFSPTKRRGHRPVHVAPPTFRQPWGGRGLGPGRLGVPDAFPGKS